MATEIKMPQLSDTMSSGKILVWKKKEGDKVSRGDVLAEVETDKANLEIECFHPGTLIKIVIPEGSTAVVGEAIAFIGQAGEAVNGAASVTPKAAAPQAAAPTKTLNPNPALAPAPTPAPQSHPTEERSAGDRIIASPLAKRIAQENNVDLSSLSGTGPGGRIVKKDVEASKAGSAPVSTPPAQAPVVPQTAKAPSAPVAGPGTLTPFSKMRETIARRMQESVNTHPHFFVTTSINMEAVSKLRELLKEKDNYKGISVNHLVIKAAGYALTKEPKVNCAVKDGQLYTPPAINIGIVMALPDGLLIPVIKDVDKLALKDVVFEARAAVERAKAGRPSASDLSGGTFTISNMGMFDVENFTAIISPGQGAILAISSTKEVPVVEDGQIKIAKQMKVTISSDHRIIDGIMAANFLSHFKEALEFPALLALE